MVRIETQCGYTEGSLAYYAEVEPRLLRIREVFLKGERDKDEVMGAVQKIAGEGKLQRDWDEVTGDCKFQSEREAAWKAHLEANPNIDRLYGSSVVIAGFVMAPEEEGG